MNLTCLCGIPLVVFLGMFAPGEPGPSVNATKAGDSEIVLRSLPIVTIESTLASNARYKFAFHNETNRPVRYMQGFGGPKSAALLEFSLFRNGVSVPRTTPSSKPVAFVKSRVQSLSPNQAIHSEFILGNYRNLRPGRYEVKAKYDIKKDNGLAKEFGLTPFSFDRTVMILDIVESVPKKMSQHTHFRFNRIEDKSHYILGVDIGTGSAWEKNSTLFFVVRASDVGTTTLPETPKSVLRLLRIDPDSKIETMVYDPFPKSDDSIIQVHILVTEPNKQQHHVVVDLTESGNPKLPTIKTKKKLSGGGLHKLEKDGLGGVTLVPVR